MTEDLATHSDTTRRGTVRSFVAVPLPAGVRSAILAAVHDGGPAEAAGPAGQAVLGAPPPLAARPSLAPLAARLPDVRWVRRLENLHVTLKFLGQVGQGLLARFVAVLAAELAPVAGFDVDLRGFGAFPSPRDAQVIWVGVDDPARRLAGVAGIVEDVAGRLAVGDDHASSKRTFSAHVTVGRVRRARHGVDATEALGTIGHWADRPFGRAAISEVHVYESITGGDASTYILRGTATLEGATHGDGQDRDQGRN